MALGQIDAQMDSRARFDALAGIDAGNHLFIANI
jgi:hypothetical protein